MRDAGEDAGLTVDPVDAVAGPGGDPPVEPGVLLEVDPSAVRATRADPDQLHRIFVNLFRNARQAIETRPPPRSAGRVRVMAEERGDRLAIRIADTGPGLPERAKARLFQAFSGSQRPDGAGLGLAIARELALGHGGDLALVSSSEAGAVFELTLPLRSPGDPEA
jgi:signal transduction histidine kinase